MLAKGFCNVIYAERGNFGEEGQKSAWKTEKELREKRMEWKMPPGNRNGNLCMSAYGDSLIALIPAAVLLFSFLLPLFWVEILPFCKDTTFQLPPACGKAVTYI